MKYFISIIIIIPVLMFAQAKTGDIEKYFNGKKGAIVIYNQASDEYTRYNGKRCVERFSPASTFKILNSIIGLETGVLTDENFVIKWDGVERGMKNWNRDHSLASAMQYSAVPYYQELTRRIGKERMQAELKKTKYGIFEKPIDKVDAFWLDGSLKISAAEQVEFLKEFYNYMLPFSKRSIDIVKKIIPEENYQGAKLKFKTGTNDLGNNIYIGWLVGYVEQEKNVFYFAFNIEAGSYAEVRKLRDEASRNILKHLKIIN